jgi:subtilisin family serine protease
VAQPTRRLIVKLRGPAETALAAAVAGLATGTSAAVSAAADPTLAAFLGQHGLHGGRPLHAGQLAQRFAQSAAGKASAAARFPLRSARAPAGAAVPDLSTTYLFDLDDRSTALATRLATLRADPAVVFAEEDQVITLAYQPNDPSYASSGSWGQPYDDLWGIKRIGSGTAWDRTRGAGVVVAVVDTGADYQHPDLAANIWENPGEIPGNGIDDDGNGCVDDTRGWDFVGDSYLNPVEDNDPMDDYGHGTHVAGTVAAVGDNGIGVVGVAWSARIMAIKAIDRSGAGADSILARAIVYAADNGADVINASWGGEGESAALKEAVDYAHSQGVVVVAAAGNNAKDCATFRPASYPSVITVSALTPCDSAAYFTNFGDKIDVAAPGQDILSLQAGTADYMRSDGTSMAAPHASGAAALVLAAHPTFNNEMVRQVLRTSATRPWGTGDPRKDLQLGYGILNVGDGVAIEHALEAHITSPAESTPVSQSTTILGSAQGTGFASYVLEFGVGTSPDAWQVLRTSTTPVSEGTLGTFDPSGVPDGLYTLRLRAQTGDGHEFADQVVVDVRYVQIISPAPPAHPALTEMRKSGAAMEIVATATGPSFRSYRVQWAPGRDATTGWSSVGLVLTGGGRAPVTQAAVATFTPPQAQRGEITIRLSVVNATFESARTTTVYLEPDLLSTAWPRLLPYGGDPVTAIPARAADGSTRLIRCWFPRDGAASGCASFAADGTTRTLGIAQGSLYPVAAGRLDGAAGAQVVIPDLGGLHIVTADLETIRDIVPSPASNYACDPVVLADLDNDGLDEILAIRRNDVGVGWCAFRGALDVYRADGTRYSSNYPVASHFTKQDTFLSVTAVDLDGDGSKEIIVTSFDSSTTSQATEVYRADGSPYADWPAMVVPSYGGLALLAGDVDRDGRPEVVLSHYESGGQVTHLLTRRGELFPGWPQAIYPMLLADVDGDGRDEIVGGNDWGRFLAVRLDGSAVNVFPAPDWNLQAPPVVADIDDDGRAELLVGYPDGPGYPLLHAIRLPDGTETRSWPLFGVAGQRSAGSLVTVGDFDNDGRSDIALATPLIYGGGDSGYLIDGALSLLTTRARFSEAAAPWPMSGLDAGQNPSTFAGPPLLRANPTADASVCSRALPGQAPSAVMLTVGTDVASGAACESYLRFPLLKGPGKVLSAKLRLFGSRTSGASASDAVYAVPAPGRDFGETTLTWNNRPALGAAQGQAVALGAAWRYQEWDVSSFVSAQLLASAPAAAFAVKAASGATSFRDTLHGREVGWHQPELAIDLDRPPTVAAPAATTALVDNATTLSVLGADDRGEAGLTYTWTTSCGPAPVTFSVNGSNAAKTTQATFTKAGSYTFLVTIKDALGQSVTSTVTINVPCILPAPAWRLAGPTRFDGVATYVDAGKSPGAAAALTVAFAVTADALKNQIPVDKEPVMGSAGWTVKLRANGDLWFRIGSDTNHTDVVLGKAYLAGQRVHLACTFAAQTAKLYVNGVLRKTQTGIHQSTQATATSLRLGIPSVVATREKLAGVLEDVRIYHSALTDAQVKTLAGR